MILNEIKELIYSLPYILLYIVPGAIFLKMYAFICSKKGSDYQHFILGSIILSYIIVKLMELITKQPVLIILATIILAYYFSLFYRSSLFEKLLDVARIHKTINDNIFDDIIDFNNGTYIQVYLPNERIVYYGAVSIYDENKDGYLVLSNYLAKNYSNEIINDYSDNDTECVAIRISDISRFEISYSPESKKIG